LAEDKPEKDAGKANGTNTAHDAADNCSYVHLLIVLAVRVGIIGNRGGGLVGAGRTKKGA
jgi:hypothetical protein